MEAGGGRLIYPAPPIGAASHRAFFMREKLKKRAAIARLEADLAAERAALAETERRLAEAG